MQERAVDSFSKAMTTFIGRCRNGTCQARYSRTWSRRMRP